MAILAGLEGLKDCLDGCRNIHYTHFPSSFGPLFSITRMATSLPLPAEAPLPTALLPAFPHV